MKISKSFKTYIHIIFVFLLSQSLNAAEDFSKNIVIHEKPVKINELKFKDSDLNDVDLTNKKGNIMIINFWATWCAPCKREMPSLEKLTNKYPEIKVYAINTEKPNKLKIRDFFRTIDVASLETYYDPDFKLVKQFKMRGLPTSILIDKNGKEFGRVIGEVDFVSESFLNIIKIYQLENLWMNTNLMCIGEKTSTILNEIKWKKIFLFNPGEEEFLLYKI